MTPEPKRPDSGQFCSAHLVEIPEPRDPVWSEEAPDLSITCCTTLAVDSKLKKTTIAENVILGEVRDMTVEDDAILEDAANTTSEQLANGWLTWAKAQQPSASQ